MFKNVSLRFFLKLGVCLCVCVCVCVIVFVCGCVWRKRKGSRGTPPAPLVLVFGLSKCGKYYSVNIILLHRIKIKKTSTLSINIFLPIIYKHCNYYPKIFLDLTHIKPTQKLGHVNKTFL